MPFTMIVTEGGRAALINAANTGTLPVTITQAGVSASAHVPAETDTALPGEIKRLATVAGEVVADDTIHVSVLDSSADVYSPWSVALYLGDGTLFAIGGNGTEALYNKAAASMAALAIDIVLADIAAAAIAFGATNFTNPPATTERQGVVELATVAEAQAGIDALRALTPAAAKAAVLGWLLAQDGAGSGLDADLLDGQHGAWYADIAARLGFTPANKAGDTFTGAITVGGNVTAQGDLILPESGLPDAKIYNLAGALGFENTGVERAVFGYFGELNVKGQRGGAAGSTLPGSGNLRVIAAAAGGSSLTCFDTVDYRPVQFLREIGGTPVEVGVIRASSTGVFLESISDYRLKSDIRPIENPLQLLRRSTPYSYRMEGSDERIEGFLAHEFGEALPHAVSGKKDAMRKIEIVETPAKPAVRGADGRRLRKARRAKVRTETVRDLQKIDQTKIIPRLVAGILELADRLENLEAQLTGAPAAPTPPAPRGKRGA